MILIGSRDGIIERNVYINVRRGCDALSWRETRPPPLPYRLSTHASQRPADRRSYVHAQPRVTVDERCRAVGMMHAAPDSVSPTAAAAATALCC